ncbi:glycosyltransferase [Microvirga sp. CF3062]|uniref:glycosyltransferase n=1 Tax=Microvirga sp. CF3062 TaxID=3110182 RepID=UPI002E78AC7B|nr:glycosyltransferase [Microvirga sp. CF3062]MEE1654769.1 glycosyltransferase [Microvirga sp. CF3062]
MNVLVLTTMTPFAYGRAEEVTNQLVRQMKLLGINAEAMRLPSKGNSPERLLDEMFIFKSLKLLNVDRVISLGFPAYLVPFDSRACWILSSHPQSYDRFEELNALGRSEPRSRSVKEAVIRNDIRCFQSSKQLFAGSRAVQARMQHYHGLVPDILLPPLSDPERFEPVGDDGYILASGRIEETKSLSLLIDAMKLLPSGERLVIAGLPDNAVEARGLQEQVREAGLEGRVAFDMRGLSRDGLAALVGRARAVACTGDDPDRGLFMEAFQASKPVLTVVDTGISSNIVLNGETGIMTEPTVEALARGMVALLGSSIKAAEMGAAGNEKWRSLKVNWPATIERLLA